jgi:hypothetical protein
MHMRLRETSVIAALFCTTAVMITAQAPVTPQIDALEEEPATLLLLGGPARWSSDLTMHRQFLERFRSAVGLGRSRMVNPSLRVHDDMLLSLTVPSEDAAPLETLRYRLKSLELVGIAKHATPVAFVIGSHIDRSGAEHTRPLNRFEQRALSGLRSANEVVGQTTRSGRDVVGAIRATGECISCHATSTVGDLLGAFSYRLERLAEPPRHDGVQVPQNVR